MNRFNKYEFFNYKEKNSKNYDEIYKDPEINATTLHKVRKILKEGDYESLKQARSGQSTINRIYYKLKSVKTKNNATGTRRDPRTAEEVQNIFKKINEFPYVDYIHFSTKDLIKLEFFNSDGQAASMRRREEGPGFYRNELGNIYYKREDFIKHLEELYPLDKTNKIIKVDDHINEKRQLVFPILEKNRDSRSYIDIPKEIMNLISQEIAEDCNQSTKSEWIYKRFMSGVEEYLNKKIANMYIKKNCA